MPLEHFDIGDLDLDESSVSSHQQRLYQMFGVIANPFPSASETSGHRRMPTQADGQMDGLIAAFCRDNTSVCVAVTATQGVGKTNLLTAYESALREKLGLRGFFVIRYMSDPEGSFDKMIRAVMEPLTEEFLRSTIIKCAEQRDLAWRTIVLTRDVRTAIDRMIAAVENKDDERLESQLNHAHQWFLGLPVRKSHQDLLGVDFRLDTVESKTRAIRDLVSLGAHVGTLKGVFLLLDELEKHAGTLSRTGVVRYLLALRALIDALPRHLFLMLAMTSDALDRYSEMVPALRGRIAAKVALDPIDDEAAALRLCEFYLDEARADGERVARANDWGGAGSRAIVSGSTAVGQFKALATRSLSAGVRQRDYLNRLHMTADQVIAQSVPE